MNPSTENQELDDRLRETLGRAPAPDFNAWQEKHSDVLATPSPVLARSQQTMHPNWRLTMNVLKSLAASLLLVCGIGWLLNGGGSLPSAAFADEIPGVDNVQMMSWTDYIYTRVYSEDGQRTWLWTEPRKLEYRHPGHYRETMFNHAGEQTFVTISDMRANRSLVLDLKAKKATLKVPDIRRSENGPFAWVGSLIRDRDAGRSNVKSVSIPGQKEFDGHKVNIVRVVTRDETMSSDHAFEFYFDTATKQLVGIHGGTNKHPNGKDVGNAHFDPLKEPDKDNKPEAKWSMALAVSGITREIKLAPKLSPADFSLDPPAGFTLEKIASPTVTEEEIVAYLGASARFNDNRFPDSPHVTFDRDRFNAASFKPENELTPAEKELIAIRDKIMLREIYVPPLKKFEEDHTVAKSFHYVGSGVTVGQSDRIVAWYKLRSNNKCRAIYGDLSVKDIAESDLPLSTINK